MRISLLRFYGVLASPFNFTNDEGVRVLPKGKGIQYRSREQARAAQATLALLSADSFDQTPAPEGRTDPVDE